jgi:lysophospholipase L1-like esterase
MANAVLIAAAVPAAGVLVLALRGVSAGTSVDQVVFFIVLPILWLFAMVLALRTSASTRASIALLIVSLGIGVIAAEALLGWLRVRLQPSASTPSMLSEVLRLRSEGVDAFARIPGNTLVDLNPVFPNDSATWHPIAPAPGHATILLCNEEGPLVTYEGDRAGFDNPDAAWEGDRVDVVLLGDSYTVGVCVAGGHSLGGQLRSRWPTLNLGTSGAGPLQELALLREYAATVTPPVVVWVYYEGNDLWDLGREMQRNWLVDYLEPGHSQSLVENHEQVDAAYRSWVDSLVSVGSTAAGAAGLPPPAWRIRDLASFTTLRAVTRFEVSLPSRASAIGSLPQVLERARDDVAAWGGRLFVAYMPAYERYDALVGEAVAGKRELSAFAEGAGIPLIDLDEALRAAGDPKSLWASPRGHLSPEGYRVAADAISRAIAPSLPSRPPGE